MMKNKNSLIIALVGFSVFFLTGLYLSLSFDTLELHQKINTYHHPILDQLFKFLTKLAEAWFIVPLLVGLLFIDRKKLLFVGSAYAVSAVSVQILKNFVFSDSFRPPHFFNGKEGFHFIEGVTQHFQMSFPSGHTTTAFCLFGALSILAKRKTYSIIFISLACIIAFSRVYLSMHFIKDITAGSLLGFGATLMLYLTVFKRKV